MDEKELGAISAFLSDFSTRVNDVEEKMRLIKEKLLTLGQTVLKQNDRLNKETILIKEDIRNIKNENDRLKEVVEHIVGETAEFARKSELQILERYMKIFEPLKFATMEDVKRLINKALKEKKYIIPVEDEEE